MLQAQGRELAAGQTLVNGVNGIRHLSVSS
jgi:hypothetical protein